MIIDCISDLHGYYPQLKGGDLLIVAGDLTESDKTIQYGQFSDWLHRQKYGKKVLLAGNHDNLFEESGFEKIQDSYKDIGIEYVCDSGTEFENIKIWGTPWTTWFIGVHPKCKAFMQSESNLDNHYNSIPNDIDILICHGPMKHVLDTNIHGYACGSSSLLKHIDRVHPRLFVFGHIHEQGGKQLIYEHEGNNTLCVNASHVNEVYDPVNKPVRLKF